MQAKLNRPRIPGSVVQRQRLLDKLNKGVRRRLTLISAPAGYGKSTLVNNWLDTFDEPFAWLSLDEHDSELGRFVAYLVAAVRSHYPGQLPNTWSIVNTRPYPDPPRLADLFVHELEALPGDLILVLDDYHVVQDVAVNRFMARLVELHPQKLRQVILSRSDPPLAFSRLRASRRLVEIRSTDLSFTRDEVGEFLLQNLDDAVDEDITFLLHERTEGWPAGVQLAALSLRESEDIDSFARRFAGSSHRLISDYLVDEVFDKLDEQQRLGLLQLSLLNQFCAPLFEAVAGCEAKEDFGDNLVDFLWRNNLFVISLDDEGVWYRFHHLFCDLLRKRLGQTLQGETIATLHGRAANWYRSRGLIGHALSHLVACGDLNGAQYLLERSFLEILVSGDWPRLEGWLDHLPPTVLKVPIMKLVRAYVLHYHHQAKLVLKLVDEAEAGLSGLDAQDGELTRPIYQGLISTLRATSLDTFGDKAGSLAQAEQALRLLPVHFVDPRGLAEFHFLDSLRKMGEGERALAQAQQEFEKETLNEPSPRLVRLLMVIGNYYHANDIPGSTLTTAAMLRDLARQAQNGVALGWALYAMGWAQYEMNRLDEARSLLLELLEHRFSVHSRAVVEAYGGLALTYLAQGDKKSAGRTPQELRQFLLDRGLGTELLLADILDMRVALSDTAFFPSYSEVESLTLAIQSLPFSDLWCEPYLTATRANLRLGRQPNLERAAALLAELRARTRSVNNRRKQIQAAALGCLVQAARGEQEEALASLKEAVLMGEHVGALRSIADAGPGILPFLQQLLADNVAPDYVVRLIALLDSEAAQTRAESIMPAQQLLLRPLDEKTVHKALLTNRELDVLQLMARRFTNKEIASALSVSPNTVRKHTANIYRKLGVNNRREAAIKAETLDIIQADS